MPFAHPRVRVPLRRSPVRRDPLRKNRFAIPGAVLAVALTASLSACSLSSTTTATAPATTSGTATASQVSSPSSTAAPRCGAVTEVLLVSHDSFGLSDELTAAFTKATGCTLKVLASGDAGELTNKLALTKASPIGDAVFGIDNTFASRAVTEGVLADYSPTLPAGASAHALPGAAATKLTPVDYGDVCVNVDHTWFAAKGKPVPATLDDLTQPAYKDLFVTPGATTSSPGLAFLLATIGAKGDGWQAYWKALMANGTKITAGWTDAYSVDFSAGEGHGTRPIVLSYASSPPFTIPKAATEPTTKALLDTCFRQVEYAGVLAGARNPEGARALVSFLLSPAVQASIPDTMYMFPVDSTATLPTDWAKWAKVADKPFVVSPDQIAAQRDTWLRQWSEVTAK
ncbi:MAG TPA: thiamine ABC transporter substrate-binding protein [Dermatophilaceae bacterium]|jgi:thiamine transport system substrate-binding protein|nr:thiamine ABC transporter substrate-binding protein [Dermatophilaceae bacterium]HQD01306.1 thiamine ABC transporter substrate-binding protein [Dermatophilaceae bacterium]